MLFYNKAHSFRKCYQAMRYYSSSSIGKVLVANRGEIACRVMKTAKKMGIKTVAVFSDADSQSLHVKMADEAFHIGPPESQESYLRGDKIMKIALQTQCQAVHPGYGFLSENMEFADLCSTNGITFIGPPASAIRDMGIKSTSKAIMVAAGVPTIPGYHETDQTDTRLIQEAARIGYPVMIKAVRGGGGKGMRIARSEKEFLEQLESARNEAMKAFANSDMLLERYMSEPRHVEVQVFGDKHGNYVHLYERDCSVQRRHQKIIEEAPAPGLSSALRLELGAAATRAAKAVGYVGAGTVEFILDKNSHEYFFMEMNTRLQVEHPITEMVTGTDLVQWQFKVANGERLPLRQDEIQLKGHAFEGRIYAEDPNSGFLPTAGVLKYLDTPLSDASVRIETGVRQGDEISVYYDPMIAKLVVWGDTRDQALSKFRKQLTDFRVAGVPTNINFLLSLSSHAEFVKGNVHTNYIEEHKMSLFPADVDVPALRRVATLAVLAQLESEKIGQNPNDPFISEGHFRVNHHLIRTFEYQLNDDKTTIAVNATFLSKKQLKMALKVSHDGGDDVTEEFIVDNVSSKLKSDCIVVECLVAGEAISSSVVVNDNSINVFNANGRSELQIPQPDYMAGLSEAGTGKNQAVSPMPGVVDKIFVEKNSVVKAGDPLLTVIAMKMEYVIKAPEDGMIIDILHKVGDSVAKNTTLVRYDQ